MGEAPAAFERLGLREIVKVSRPGLIVSHLWLYLLPLALLPAAADAAWWIGALYVTVPLGLLIYGWNDFFDADVDALSSRKAGTFSSGLFGYRLRPGQRRALPAYIVAVHLPFLGFAVADGRLWAWAWVLVMAIANALYNGPGVRLSRVPAIAEVTATWIYLNILWLGLLVTGLETPWTAWALGAATVLFFQIAGAVVDIDADRRVGKITFAAAMGERRSAWALATVAAAKAALLWAAFGSPAAAVLNLAAVPFCLARPSLSGGHWASYAYFYFVIADWLCLGLLVI